MSIPGAANPLLLATAAAGGYSISRSVRFNSSDSAYLSRTPASTSNRRTWTWAGWVKRVRPTWDTDYLFGAYYGGSLRYEYLAFISSDQIDWFSGLYSTSGTTTSGRKITASVYRDPGAWYHIVAVKDTTQATASNRFKLYVNGVQISTFDTSTDPALNDESFINDSSTPHRVGGLVSTANSSQYLADIHFIDGQALTPTSFGEFDTNGIWQPKAYTGTYGTNGFHLPFSDNSTAATLGTDTAGSNDWTVNNLSVTAGVGNDSLVDVPTNGSEVDTGSGGEVRGNYCTWNVLDAGASISARNGNLDAYNVNTAARAVVRATTGVTTGKWYWEITVNTTGNYFYVGVDVLGIGSGLVDYLGGNQGNKGFGIEYQAAGVLYSSYWGNTYKGTAPSGTISVGTVIGFALDADAGTLGIYYNGVSKGNAFVNLTQANLKGALTPAVAHYGNVLDLTANFGQRPFAYTAPSGFKALCTANLPAPVVTKPSTVMDVLTWSGNNAATRAISGLNHSPDLVWIKCRSDAAGHNLYDTVRTAGKLLTSDTTAAETTNSAFGYLSQFDSAGFTLTAGTYPGYESGNVNMTGRTYVGWTWDAGSSTVTNTAGSISSQVRANQTAGFSIVSYTGTGTSPVSVGHGLNVAPTFLIFKDRDSAVNWQVWTTAISSSGTIFEGLNTTAAGSTPWTYISTTSSLLQFNSGNSAQTTNGKKFICYAFAPVAGHSSFGSYVGNGSSSNDGPFVYTGFRPKWVMIKASSSDPSGGGWWNIIDATRNTYNAATSRLGANSSTAENNSYQWMDLLSNGFKLRELLDGSNVSGVTYIYAAFAESPFNYARAR